jgi:protein-tyrosine phosphatase/membrane-associated phospholipid phosphatase
MNPGLKFILLVQYFRIYPWKSAARWLLILAPFFFASYQLANWITSLRPDVPSIIFSWEHHIPFLAWTIIPYWSTDLLYGVSLFVCNSRWELETHARRLLLVQCLSVAGFLAAPLRFGFPVPQTSGFFGWAFSALYQFDQPFNQAPSLHIGITVVLWALYSRHLRGPALWAMRGWMMLVAVSTLTTYQHHFIDLPAGLWVGLVAIVVLPFDKSQLFGPRSADPDRFRIAFRYLAGGVLLIILASRLQGVFWLLLWPGGSLVLIAVVYVVDRPDLFGKRQGKLPAPVVCLAGPYLAGAWLNYRRMARREHAFDEIDEGVRVGRLPGPAEHTNASIVDLTGELSFDPAGAAYRSVPMLDLLVPDLRQLAAAVQAIDELSTIRPTLVCCAGGYSRSAMAVAAWLLARGKAGTVGEAIAQIRARRPRIVLGPAHRARLEEWIQARVGVTSAAG